MERQEVPGAGDVSCLVWSGSKADNRFEPSDVARANEVAQGNIKPDDVVPIMRKRTGPNGLLATCFP